MKYSLSGSQNFFVIGFWNQWLPNTSRVARKEKVGVTAKGSRRCCYRKTCLLKSFRFRSARFSRVALVLKPWPLFALLTTWRKSRGRVLLGILGGGEPPSSLTPGLISNQKKNVIFHALFQSWPPGRNCVIEFANISFSFLFIYLELKRQIILTRRFFARKP